MYLRELKIILVLGGVLVALVSAILLTELFSFNEKNEKQEFYCGSANDEFRMNYENGLLIDGKAVYYANCASCHHPAKESTGPPLNLIKEFRQRDWVCRYIRDDAFNGDERSELLRTKYEANCIKNSSLSCLEIEAALAVY